MRDTRIGGCSGNGGKCIYDCGSDRGGGEGDDGDVLVEHCGLEDYWIMRVLSGLIGNLLARF